MRYRPILEPMNKYLPKVCLVLGLDRVIRLGQAVKIKFSVFLPEASSILLTYLLNYDIHIPWVSR